MKMRMAVILVAFTFFTTTKSFAQTVVVTDDATYVTGQASSVLDVKSISKGFLAPRMTTAQRTAIISPAEGLLVYQTDAPKGFYFFSNGLWASLAANGASWLLTGNAGTSAPIHFVGTTDLKSLRFKTNATQGMILDSLGNLGIGAAPAFTAGTFQEKFLVDAGTTSSFNAIIGRGSINNYLQLNIQNLSNGTSASSDVVATADNGNETVNFVDLGINSSTNTQNVMGASDDAYLYTTGNNFLIGTGTAAKALVFLTGGTTQSTNERMRIDGTGKVGIGTTTPLTALHVVGTNPLTLNGVQTGAISDSILTIASGTIRKLPFSTLTSGASWSLIGNTGTNYLTNFLGTTDNTSLRFRTDNIQGMILDSLGNVGIGTAPAFTVGTDLEQLLVDAGVTNSFNAIVGKGTINNYLQLNIQNLSSGTSASSDVVATADNGTEAVNYVDLGINSSTNTQNVMGAADDAYLYTTGNNFLIGTGTSAKALIFMTGGTTESTNERMRIDGSGNLGLGTNAPLQKLDVNGNMRLTGAFMPGNLAGAAGDVLISSGAGIAPTWFDIAAYLSTNAWVFGGNSVTSLQKIGTTSNFDFSVITNNVERMRVTSTGNVGIGTATPTSTLQVAGSLSMPIATKTASYTVLSSDHTIECNNTAGSITISLPDAVGIAGRIYVIKKISVVGNNVVLDALGTETIDGSLTNTISNQYGCVMIQSDGANWIVLSAN
jgi:hypothetical protein